MNDYITPTYPPLTSDVLVTLHEMSVNLDGRPVSTSTLDGTTVQLHPVPKLHENEFMSPDEPRVLIGHQNIRDIVERGHTSAKTTMGQTVVVRLFTLEEYRETERRSRDHLVSLGASVPGDVMPDSLLLPLITPRSGR